MCPLYLVTVNNPCKCMTDIINCIITTFIYYILTLLQNININQKRIIVDCNIVILDIGSVANHHHRQGDLGGRWHSGKSYMDSRVCREDQRTLQQWEQEEPASPDDPQLHHPWQVVCGQKVSYLYRWAVLILFIVRGVVRAQEQKVLISYVRRVGIVSIVNVSWPNYFR